MNDQFENKIEIYERKSENKIQIRTETPKDLKME